MSLKTLSAALLCGCAAIASGKAMAADTDSGSNVSELVVTAPRQEAQARVVQEQAPNLITVQSAESMAKYPDFNAAESLGRLPGISLSSDTGEGRFINIRGIDGNLDGATFGGVPLLNTFPGGTYFSGGGRAVEFDTLPDGAIDGLVVTYTGLPDHEAEGLGGSVELTPRTAANITRPFIDGSAGSGYEPEHGHDGPTSLDLAAGARFGFLNGRLVVEGRDQTTPLSGWITNPTPFSFVITGSSRIDRRGFDDMEEDYNNPGTSDRSYQDLQLRHYDYHRERFGGGGEFDFTPNDDHSYYFRANVAGYIEAVKKNRLTYDFSNYDQTAVGTGFQSPADLSVATTDERETHRNDIYAAGGRDAFGKIVLDYRVSYTQASYDQDKNYGASFVGPTGVAMAYDNSGNNGDFPKLTVIDGTNVNNAALYTLKKGQVSDSQEHDNDREWAYAVNLQIPAKLFSDDDHFKIGVEARLRNKSQNQYDETLKIGALNLASVSSGADTSFYGDRYTNGPNANTLAIRSLAEAVEGPDQWDPTGYFNAREDIYSGYIQYQATRGPLGMLAGVRVENTEATYGNYEFDGDGNPVTPAGTVATQLQQAFFLNNKDYTNLFPTVQLRYTITPQLLVRATYSTGIGRPGFNQVTGAVTVDEANGIITTGNPNLKPTTGDNFDLDLEYYLPGGGIAQIGVFDKDFENYIVTRQTLGTDPRIIGTVKFQTFENISSAYARGVQFAYHQQFTALPKPLEGLGIDANATYVDSRIEEYDAATSAAGVAQYGTLPGTSRYTANAAVFYEAHNVNVRLSTQYVGHQLFSLGGSKQSDTIEDDRTTLDLATSYKFMPGLTAYFNVRNLTDAPLRFYVGSPSFPIQREFYGQTYEAGIRFHF